MFLKAEARDEAGYYAVGIFAEPSQADDYPRYIAHLKAQPEPHRYFVLLVDTRHGVPPTAAERRAIAQAGTDAVNTSFAFVTESMVGRNFLSLMAWLARPAYTSKAVCSFEDASRWMRAEGSEFDGWRALMREARRSAATP